MELLQKINSVVSAGVFRWRNVVVCVGIFFFLFSAAGIGSLCAEYRLIKNFTRGVFHRGIERTGYAGELQ